MRLNIETASKISSALRALAANADPFPVDVGGAARTDKASLFAYIGSVPALRSAAVELLNHLQRPDLAQEIP